MKNYYEVLEISPNANIEAIKKAFRVLALRYHPDKSKDASTAKLFIEITEAYEVLRDPAKKSKYDALRTPKTPEPFVSQPPHPSPQETVWKTEGEKKAQEYASMSYNDFIDRICDEIGLVVSYAPNFVTIIIMIFGLFIGLYILVNVSFFQGLIWAVMCFFGVIISHHSMVSDYKSERRKMLLSKYQQ